MANPIRLVNRPSMPAAGPKRSPVWVSRPVPAATQELGGVAGGAAASCLIGAYWRLTTLL
jgi:hypothetical protein